MTERDCFGDHPAHIKNYLLAYGMYLGTYAIGVYDNRQEGTNSGTQMVGTRNSYSIYDTRAKTTSMAIMADDHES